MSETKTDEFGGIIVSPGSVAPDAPAEPVQQLDEFGGVIVAQPDPWTVGRGLIETAKGIPQGAASLPAGLLQMAGTTQDLLHRHLPEAVANLISPAQTLLTGAKAVGLASPDTTLGTIGQSIEDKVNELVPSDPRSDWTRAVGQGVGQIVPAILTGTGVAALTRGAVAKAAATAGISGLTMFGAEFSDAYDRAIGHGDDPDLAFAKSLGYASISAAIENKFGVGRLAKKLVQRLTPEAAETLIRQGVTRSAIADFLIGQGKDVAMNFGEEAAQRLAQDLIIEGRPEWDQIFKEGAVGGLVAAIVGIPGNVRSTARLTGPQREALYQWDKAKTEAKVSQPDEATPPPVLDARHEMESAALRGDTAGLEQAKTKLAELTTPGEAKAAEIEITRAQEKLTENLQAIAEKAALPQDQWHQIIQAEGFSPDQYEIRPGVAYHDAVTGWATDKPTDAEGNPNRLVEGYYAPETRKIVLMEGGITGDRRDVKGLTKAARQKDHLRLVVRHEAFHQAADTPEGQELVGAFALGEMQRSPELSGFIAQLRAQGYPTGDIPEEYLANLYQRDKWWKAPVDRLRRKISEWFPRLGRPPVDVAGRILARQLVKQKGVTPSGQVQEKETGVQVAPQETGAEAASVGSQPAPVVPAIETPPVLAALSGKPITPPAESSRVPAAKPARSEEEDAKLRSNATKPEVAETPPSWFKTDLGSLYESHGDGTTTRTKAKREGHTDYGPKERSARTVYVDPQLAREIGMWQTLSSTGKRILLANGTVTLVSNNAAGKPGRDRVVSDPKFSESPAVGLSPLELWEPEQMGGQTAYRGNHPGNVIVESGLGPAPAVQVETTPAPTPAQQPDAEAKARERAALQAELDAEMEAVQETKPAPPAKSPPAKAETATPTVAAADVSPPAPVSPAAETPPASEVPVSTTEAPPETATKSEEPKRRTRVGPPKLRQKKSKAAPPVEATPTPEPTPEPTPAPKNVAPEQPQIAALEPAPIETPQPQPEPPAPATPEVVPPTPVPGESELRREERKEGKPEASNERKTSTAKALKVQKEYLVKAVEEALRDAPESVETPADMTAVDELQRKHDEAERSIRSQHGSTEAALKMVQEAKELAASEFKPLFKRYGIGKEVSAFEMTKDGPRHFVSSDLKHRVQALRDEINRSIWRGPQGITFDVPGDGVFTVVNDRPTLKKFLETVKDRFPTTAAKAPAQKGASTKPESIPKASKPKSLADRVDLLKPFVSDDPLRRVVTRVAHSGNVLVATDGRSMAVIPAGESTDVVRQYDVKTGDEVTKEDAPSETKVLDKATGAMKTVYGTDDLQPYPNYRQVVPTTVKWRAQADVAALLKMTRGAIKLFEGEDKKIDRWDRTVALHLDPAGNFGVSAMIPDSGSFESGVTPEAKIIGYFTPDPLAEALELAAKMGNEKVWVGVSDDGLEPMGMLGKDFGHLLMPRRGAGGDVGVGTDLGTPEAKSSQSDLSAQWSKLWNLEAKEAAPEPKPKQKAAKRKADTTPQVSGESGVVSQPKPKFSLSPDQPRPTTTGDPSIDRDIDAFREQFPGAPQIVTRERAERGREGQAAYFDAGWNQIVVVRRLMPRWRAGRRGVLLGALEEAGQKFVPETFWETAWNDLNRIDPAMLQQVARSLNVDPRDPAGRRAVMWRLVQLRKSNQIRFVGGLVRSVLRFFRADAPTGRVVDQIQRQLERTAEDFIPATPATFKPEAPEQVFADTHAAVWGLRGAVYGLRDRANHLVYQAIDQDQWARIRHRLNELAGLAESNSIGAERRFRPSPDSENFIDQLEENGVVADERDIDAHQLWLDELAARRLVTTMDSLQANERTSAFLSEGLQKGDGSVSEDAQTVLRGLQRRINRQRAEIERVAAERPDIHDRATAIRSATDRTPEAKSARDTLAAPEIQEWLEIVRQIEDSGVTPRGASDLSPTLRDQVETASGMFAHHARELRQIIAERTAKSGEELVKRLRQLQKARAELGKKHGDVEVRITELLQSAMGDQRASGGLFTREFSELVRQREHAIARLAILLGRAEPGSVAEQFLAHLTAPGAANPDATLVREVANASNITPEVLSEILELANRQQRFRETVLMLADEADARAERRVLNVIEQIEAARGQVLEEMAARPAGEAADPVDWSATEQRAEEERSAMRREAFRAGMNVASGMLQRLRLERREAGGELSRVEAEIQQAEIEQRTNQMLNHLADEAVRVSTQPDTLGTAEMYWRTTSHGIHLAEFKRADGQTQAAVSVQPGREFNQETLNRIFEWREQAIAAAESGVNPPHITRGLRVGAARALQIIDAGSLPGALQKTQRFNALNKTLAKTPAVTRQTIARLLPGIQGTIFAQNLADYARLGRLMDGLLADRHSQWLKFLTRAYESIGLNPYQQVDQQTFERIYSEVAHRLREHGSSVRVGDRLFSPNAQNFRVTREMMTLIRYDRDSLKQAQRIIQSEPFGGIRERLGRIRLIRPSAETGDIGLARKVNRTLELELANELTSQEAVNRDNPDMTAYWSVNHPEHLVAHILDVERLDLAFDRSPLIRPLVRQYARDIRAERAPAPHGIAEAVDALAGYAGTAIANAPETIRRELMAELMTYARVAKSRAGKAVSDNQLTQTGQFIGEDDTNEFTSPAAKMILPSSFYDYGVGNDFRGAIENVLDSSQVSMLDSAQAAIDALNQTSQRLGSGVGFTDEDEALARWFIAKPKRENADTALTPEDLSSAKKVISEVVSILKHEIEQLRRTGGSYSRASQLIRASFPFLLAFPRVAMAQIAGGPMTTFHVMSPITGKVQASVLAVVHMLNSGIVAAYNILDHAAHWVGLSLPRSDAAEGTMEWLESIGWGSFYSHSEVERMQSHMSGSDLPSRIIRAVARAGETFEQTVGRRVGITAADAHLNRYAAQWVVPQALWQLQKRAQRWQARLARAGVTPGPTTDPRWIYNDTDNANAAAIRGQLIEAGLNPEQFMADLAAGRINPRRYFEFPEGRKFALAVIADFNAASRANRPHPTTVLALMGWSAATVQKTIDLMRQPVDRSRLRRLVDLSTMGLGLSVASMASYYFQQIARQGFNEVQTALAQNLAAFVAAPPDDDDELFPWLRNVLARILASFEVNTSPQPLPWDKSWRDRPMHQIALELLRTIPASLGIDRVIDGGGSLTTAALGIGANFALGIGFLGKGVIDAAQGKKVEAGEDIRMSLRSIAGNFGEPGRVLANFALGQTHRRTVHDIRAAANDAGIQYTPAPAPSGLAIMRDTPLRQALIDASERLSEAKPEEREAAKQRLVDVARSIYQRAYDKVIDRGGFASPEEAKEEADRAGQRSVQQAVSQIEPVTRALGRSVTPDEFEKLKASGVLNTPEVMRETRAVQTAAEALSSVATPTGARPMVSASQSVTSPVVQRGAGFASGGQPSARSSSGLATRTTSAMPRLRRASSIRGLRRSSRRARLPRLRRAKTPRLRLPRLA